MGASKASVLYIYIYIDDVRCTVKWGVKIDKKSFFKLLNAKIYSSIMVFKPGQFREPIKGEV